MRKALLFFIVVAVIGGSVYGYLQYTNSGPKVTINTAQISRGDIIETVGATGTLQAVTTVQVGSQVSGTIQSLGADFNSIVKKGQVIARLDPSLFDAQLQQARANLSQSQANLEKAKSDLERQKVMLTDAQQKYTRAKSLADRKLLTQSDLDAAQIAVDSAVASLASQQSTLVQAEAAVKQSQATVDQNEVNLQHTIIEAPIDGLVIARSVDVGQTVAASMQAPTLFILAADLTKMQVLANLDESDVGRIRPQQRVTFRVDAYPNEEFVGTVSQVRLQPTVVQNVVTYSTVINVPNDQLKLKPGMTANVKVELERSSDVLRVPNSALRFRPTTDVFAALGQTPPDQGQQRPGGNAGNAGNGRRGNADASGNGGAPNGQGRPGRGGAPRDNAPAAAEANLNADAAPIAKGATTIDAMFGPLPRTETTGRVWVNNNQQLDQIRLRLGITDGQLTEIIEGNVQPGQEVVTNASAGTASARPAPTNSPFPGGNPRGGFPGAPGGGGGRGR
ncbi:MAG: efflux RND transporter periplasmic adaptor subunit [Acidobacteriaceae bacterium]|jgi:HlyD family secretion protein|nr:efflux RND transporter periplasmic adaptor subunit [Acidobacteriaceae bacterium]